MSGSLTDVVRLARLAWLDETTRGEHWALARDDHCLFLGEYLPGASWAGGAFNSLVLDFKRAPSRILASPYPAAVRRFKKLAIETVALALRRGFGRATVETALTFVPLPTSKRPGDDDYCDRLARALQRAFEGWDADIRPLLRLKASSRADHERHAERVRRGELLELMELDLAQLERPLRPMIVLFDDVLTSGKHVSVAKARIRERFPGQPIVAVLVGRVSRDDSRVRARRLLMDRDAIRFASGIR